MTSFDKVIIWGYPLDTHTHSYIHYGWLKAFKSLGYEAYWFSDENYPSADVFKYTNCLFITEGYADRQIPLHSSNIYLVHVAVNPKKYLDSGARFIDLRYNVTGIKDCNYVYQLEGKSLETIHPTMLYEANATDRDLNPRFRHHSPLTYEAIYIAWATDLLPDEIEFKDRFIEPEMPPVTYFIGSLVGANIQDIQRFADACVQRGIRIVHHDPWRNPVSFKEAQEMVQRSIVCPDIRGSGDPNKIRMGETGTCHKSIGYIPCRLFKNISYGKLGMTNCPRLKELFGDMVILETDEAKMVDVYLEKSKDKEYILKQMEWVKEHHTYIRRVQDLLKIVYKQ
jgi:hypothetical protein